MASLKHFFEKGSSPSHHVDKILRHIQFLSLKIGRIICFELVAVKVEKLNYNVRKMFDRPPKEEVEKASLVCLLHASTRLKINQALAYLLLCTL
ncbi:unnamed protein product [Prunus armeniaca]|uniref:Uncharacterized protein n=1 Tax=Prunus armeniaca TaxID=36596 RepID=A0A6J5WCM3_PRUAR|nr:unnamed protein product [Prunus armeniaca]